MFVVFFYDNNNNKIKIEDLANSIEDAEKKIIQFGKDFIEIENGRKHLEKCVKDFNCDLSKEDDGFYLIKHVSNCVLEKVELIKKVIKIDEIKGWTGTYCSTKTETYNLGYYSYTHFDKKLLNIYSQNNKSIEITSTENKTTQVSPISSINNFSSVISALKDSGFKPTKNCTFKFNINKKQPEHIEEYNNNFKYDDLITNLNKITKNEIKKLPEIPQKENNTEIQYEEENSEVQYEEINSEEYIVSDIDDGDMNDYLENYLYDSDEHYDLLANENPINYYDNVKSEYLYSGEHIVEDINRVMTDSESEYLYSDEYPDYYMDEDINNKVDKVATKNLGDIKFIRKEWKCD
jgi:hypothetical protein